MHERDKFSIEPLYAQVRRHLADRISSGVWSPGSVLPNEQELARELGVSPGTVRKALDILEAAKLVTRRQGKGTFVLDQASQELAVRFSNIRDGDGQRIVGDMELLTREKAAASSRERDKLRLDPDEQVVRLVRVRRHEAQPFMYEEVSLPLSRFRGLDDSGAENDRITALAQRHGIHLARSSEQVGMVEAASPVAAHLNVAAGTPLLKLDRVITATDGLPVEWRIGLCHLGEKMLYLGEVG